MTITSSYARQPTKLDYASPTQFKFQLTKLPKVEYFCTAVNIPGLALSTVNTTTPLKNLPMPGDQLTYGDLTMTFLADENLENFREIHGWMVGLGFPEDHNQFQTLAQAGNDRFPGSNKSVSTEAGKVKYDTPRQGGTLSDATLLVLSNKNNPVLEVRFEDVFPIELGSLQYNQGETDINYLSVEATFRYTIYKFAEVGRTATVTTT
jgi:hypothetical protein